jgi:hypothetical protein
MKPNDVPGPGEFPAPMPPPRGVLNLLMNHRFLIISLVVILFLGSLFVWEAWRSGSAPSEPAESPVAAVPHSETTSETTPAAPTGLEEKPLAPAPPKVSPALPSAPAPPHREATSAIPPASPVLAPPPREPVKGEVFTQALIKILDDQIRQTWFGWRPNTIIFGKFGLTDNVNNIQLGVLEVARRTVVVLNEHMTRFATTEAYNPRVNEAMNFFMVSPDKYWFPSASGKYREAMQDLEKYIEDLKVGRARFYSRVDYLIALMSNYKDLLGSSYHNLIKDTEADGQTVSWSMVDDYFYYSQGIALAMAEMLEAVTKEFHQELLKKNSHKLLDDAIHSLHAASHLSPWIVTNGAKDGILSNHRANMSTYIGEAEHVISTLQQQLATN